MWFLDGWWVGWLLWEAGRKRENEFILGYVHAELPMTQSGMKCLEINQNHCMWDSEERFTLEKYI